MWVLQVELLAVCGCGVVGLGCGIWNWAERLFGKNGGSNKWLVVWLMRFMRTGSGWLVGWRGLSAARSRRGAQLETMKAQPETMKAK